MQRTSIIFHHTVGNADLKTNQKHIQMKIAYLYVRVSTDEQKKDRDILYPTRKIDY